MPERQREARAIPVEFAAGPDGVTAAGKIEPPLREYLGREGLSPTATCGSSARRVRAGPVLGVGVRVRGSGVGSGLDAPTGVEPVRHIQRLGLSPEQFVLAVHHHCLSAEPGAAADGRVIGFHRGSVGAFRAAELGRSAARSVRWRSARREAARRAAYGAEEGAAVLRHGATDGGRGRVPALPCGGLAGGVPRPPAAAAYPEVAPPAGFSGVRGGRTTTRFSRRRPLGGRPNNSVAAYRPAPPTSPGGVASRARAGR